MNTNEVNEPDLSWRNMFQLLMQRINQIEDRIVAGEKKIDNKFDTIENTINESTTWVSDNIVGTLNEVASSLDKHIKETSDRDQEYRNMNDEVHERITSSFDSLSSDLERNIKSLQAQTTLAHSRLDEFEEDLHACRNQEDIRDNIPEIDSKVQEAVDGLLGNVEFINHNIANDLLLMKDKLVSLDARVTSFAQPAEADPSNEWYRVLQRVLRYIF